MQAIIDNKLYDTETAELIFTYKKNEPQPILFSHTLGITCWREVDIYKTKKDNYFIYIHKGSVNSSVSFGDLKERIELISKNEVKEIIRKLDVEKYIRLFGEVKEG